MHNSYRLDNEHISFEYTLMQGTHNDLCSDHCHDRYEITYCLSPTGRYIVEGSEHKVVCGTIMLITPMSYHHVMLNGDDNKEFYSLHFSREALPSSILSMLDGITDSGESRGRIFSPDIIPAELIAVFERFSIVRSLPESEGKAYVKNLLSEIVILLSAIKGNGMIASENELGARVAKYINLSIEKNVSLDKLAQRFFVSKYHLCRAFKAYSGTSVHTYINRKRIMHAKMLIESGMTAYHVAERVGFGDYSAFYRAYLKVVGKSPTAN